MTPCKECHSECCKYVTVHLDKPKDKEDWDEMKWLLMHESILVYKDNDGDWQVEFRTKCKNLGSKSGCNIYDKRPEICREHDPKDCDMSEGEFGEIIFNKPEDVDEYLKKK